MKQFIISLFMVVATMAVKAQTATIDTNEIKTLSRNALIIQQQLHTLPINALIRDKLDSVYNQTAAILQDKYRRAKTKPVTKEKP